MEVSTVTAAKDDNQMHMSFPEKGGINQVWDESCHTEFEVPLRNLRGVK